MTIPPPPPQQCVKKDKLAAELRAQKVPESEIKKMIRKTYGIDQYTFMSYNAITLKKLKYGRGDYFKFILRKKSAYSKSTVGILRALLDAGTPRPPLMDYLCAPALF